VALALHIKGLRPSVSHAAAAQVLQSDWVVYIYLKDHFIDIRVHFKIITGKSYLLAFSLFGS